MIVNFVKAESLGNDFVILNSPFPDISKTSVKIADRKKGIGCDQVIWIDSCNNVRFFNSDGSESSTCINGTRAVALYLSKILESNKITINTKNCVIECFVDADLVKANFPLKYSFENLKNDYELEFAPSFIDIGNPHMVLFVKDNFLITHKDLYKKFNCNITFAKILDERTVSIQTYERGVGFTDACGSASLATVISAKENGLNIEHVNQKGGTLSFVEENEYMIINGNASIVFEGKINIENNPVFLNAKVQDLIFSGDHTVIKAVFFDNSVKEAFVNGVVSKDLIGKNIKGCICDDDKFIVFAKINDYNILEIVSYD